jgi:hypothetical protein
MLSITSIKHHFINEVNGAGRRKCKYCSSTFALKTANNTLRKHISQNHPQQYSQFNTRVNSILREEIDFDKNDNDDAQSSAGMSAFSSISSTSYPSSFSSSSKQSSLKSSVNQYQRDNFHDLLAVCFAKCSLSLRLIEVPEFKEALKAFKTCDVALPTRKQLAKFQQSLALKSTQQILENAAHNELPSSLALDGWSNINQSKVTNVLLLTLQRPYFLKSIENKYEATTSDWLYEKLSPIIQDLCNKKIRICGIVMDNASVNTKLYELLSSTYPHLIRLPCAAHVVQLCVHQILKIDDLKDIIEFMEEILSTFRSNSAFLQRLKKLQADKINLNETSEQLIVDLSCTSPVEDTTTLPSSSRVLTLLRPVDTRWSSSLLAAERIMLLQDQLQYIINEHRQHCPRLFEMASSKYMWKKLGDLIQLLQPFQLATNVLQSDSSNLYSVYRCFSALMQSLDQVQGRFGDLQCRNIKNIIVRYWRKHVNLEATVMSAIFSFDQTHTNSFTAKELGDAKRWFIEFATSYLIAYGNTEERDALSGIITRQYVKFRGKAPPFDELNALIKKAVISSRHIKGCNKIHKPATEDEEGCLNFDPKEIWFYYQDELPELASCALAILSLPSSEAAVERSFSKQSIVHRKHRNRLSSTQVETEMMIKYNVQHHDRKSNIFTPNVLEIDTIETNDSACPLFELEEEFEVDDTDILEEKKLDDRSINDLCDVEETSRNGEATSQKRSLPQDASAIKNIPDISSTAVASKRRRVHERAAVVIPYEDIANLNSFISRYVEGSSLLKSIKRNDATEAAITLALSEWATQHPPIKDTIDVVIAKINLYIKSPHIVAAQKNEEQDASEVAIPQEFDNSLSVSEQLPLAS